MKRKVAATASGSTPIKTYRTLPTLLKVVRDFRVCEAHLPLGPRPILQVGADARILVVGQAPAVGFPSSCHFRSFMLSPTH